jgi:hypothetical protein
MDKGSINQTPTRILMGEEYSARKYSPVFLRRYVKNFFFYLNFSRLEVSIDIENIYFSLGWDEG